MLVLMVTPALMAVFLVLLLRRRQPDHAYRPVRGIWLVIVAIAVKLGVGAVRTHTSLPESAVNRVGAAVVIAVLALFVWLNRDRARRTVVGAWLIACGAGLNAVSTLAYGYMPALGSAARKAGYDVGDSGHPFAGYVLSDRMNPIARYTGDFIPIPGQLKVLSIGDLMLIAGLVVLLVDALRNAGRSASTSPESA